MHIAICDDNREDSFTLRSLLSEHRVSLFPGPQELLDALAQGTACYDLYLLDIYMESTLNGIELARKLRTMDEEADICFISSSDEFYREAYDIQDVNYLLKPVSEEALRQLVDRVLRRQTKRQHQSFSFRRKGLMETIPYSSILFFTSHGHLLDIYCADGSIQSCSAKLDDVEAMLDDNVFLRCHQSFLVNLYQIDHLSGYELFLGKQRIPVSRRYFPEVKRRYQESLFEEVN